jgi:ABC-2 type transport system permease protein
MFQIGNLPILEPYGGNPIAYILTGVSGWTYLWSAMNAPSVFIRNEMLIGTFEYIFYTPTSKHTVVVSYVIRGLAISTFLVLIYIFIGFVFFDVKIQSGYIYGFIIMAISILMMIGIGLVIAGLRVRYKEIGTLVSIFQTLAVLFSNVYFDVSILPSTIRPIAYIWPTYYSITGLRLSLLSSNPNTNEIMNYIKILLAFCVVTLIIGIIIFNKAFDKARKDGSLAYY